MVSVTYNKDSFSFLCLAFPLLFDAGQQPGGEMFHIVYQMLNCCNIKADRRLNIDLVIAVPVDLTALCELMFPDTLVNKKWISLNTNSTNLHEHGLENSEYSFI